jgi:hypothetical protein
MITNAIGRPTPNALPIVNAKAESKLAPTCMPLLHRAPAGTARRPRMNDQSMREAG